MIWHLSIVHFLGSGSMASITWSRSMSSREGSTWGQVGTGEDRWGQMRTGGNRRGQERRGGDRWGQVRTGEDRWGQLGTVEDRWGQVMGTGDEDR